MKRLLRVLGVLILIIVAAMLILPVIFKDEIIARAKTEMNENLNARVEFADIGLSLFRSFPNFTLSIEDINVDGTGTFEGVRLLSLESFRLDLDLMSVVSGNQFEIEKIILSGGDVHILIDTSGAANYDIVKVSETPDEAETENAESASFRLELKSYALKNINLVYDDPAGAIYVDIRDLDHIGQGDFTQDIVNLSTKTSLRALTVGYEGIDYLSRAVADMDADMVYDQNSGQLSFGENLLTVNDLPLEFTGTVSLPEDKVVMNLSFESPSQDIKNMLSLIPAIYTEGYEDMEANGSFSFSGEVKGEYDYADHYPAYDINLVMEKGSFQYPDLPASVDGIDVKAHIFNETSDLDGVEIDVPMARARIAGNPVEARIMLSDPMVNPTFDVRLNADLDLANLARVVPMEGYDFKGVIKAVLEFAGDMASVENEDYSKLKAEGNFSADSLTIAGDSIAQPIEIGRARVAVSPEYLDIQYFLAKMGNSDFRLIGRLDNLIGYALSDGVLKGNFSVDADKIDLNELSASDSESSEAEVSDTASVLSVIRIPENLDIKFAGAIRQLVYDNLMINDVVGRMNISNAVASMEQLDMRLLGGRARMSGSYDSKPEQPEVDFNLDLRNFDIRESYQKFFTIRQLAPVMKNSSGLFNTTLRFKTKLNQDMIPDLGSLFASGKLGAKNLSSSPAVLQKLSGILGKPDMAILRLDDINLRYFVEDGRVKTEPFIITSGSLRSVISGSMGVDKSLDYTMDLSLPLKDIGAANLLNQLGSDPNQEVDIKVFIGGTATNPSVNTSLKDMAGSLKDKAVEEVKKKVEEVVDDAKDQAREKSNQLIADAEAKGDQLIAEAQRQADLIVSEAEKQADLILKEANAKARKIEDEAKGNFLAEKGAKASADKVRSEADKKASQLVNEARKKANDLVDQARNEKVKLVEEARAKANAL